MKKIAVIGLGLIGTSLLKALQNKGYELYGISGNPETIKKALEQNLVVKASSDFDLIRNMDVIFIATPIESITKIIEKIRTTVSRDSIIADLAGVKSFVLDYVHNLDVRLNFIGLHPMAGTENKGFDNAVEGLFEDSKWAVIPSNFAKRESVAFIAELIRQIGAKPVLTDAKSHDRAVAMISHLPLILAQSLFLSASDKLEKDLASSGFRDMTRLAMSNSDIAHDMVKFNKTNILECLVELDFTAKNLLKNYSNTDIEKISAQRREMYSKDGKNKY